MTNRRQKAHRYGLHAEKFAAWYLRLKGYRILAERYRNPQGEIDLLAKKGKTLIAVEVKARQTMAQCEISITPFKQQKIMRAVEWLIAGRGKITGLKDIENHTIRFDVIWVANKRLPVHIKNAWGL